MVFLFPLNSLKVGSDLRALALCCVPTVLRPGERRAEPDGTLSSRLHIPPAMSTPSPRSSQPACFPLQCSPRESPSRRGLGHSPGSLYGPEARESRGGPGPGCRLLTAQGMASPCLRRWLCSTRLLRAGRPPGLRLSGPPGAPPAGVSPLRGRRARDRRVLLPEQTVHLGCGPCRVAAPRAPQPIRVPASRLVSSHRVSLSMTHAHEEKQGERQKAPPGGTQGVPGAGGGGRRPHGAGGRSRAVRAGDGPGKGSLCGRPPAGCARAPFWRPASPRLGDPESDCRPGSPRSEDRAAGETGDCAPCAWSRAGSPAARAPLPHLRAFSASL